MRYIIKRQNVCERTAHLKTSVVIVN